MNENTDNTSTTPATLREAIHDLTGRSLDLAAPFELGPGTIYLLELPTRQIRFIVPKAEAFSKAFYNLVESVETFDDLVAPEDQDSYRKSWGNGFQESEVRFQLTTSRRGATAPVIDYRAPLTDAAGNLVGAIGRLVDDSFRATAMDALVRRSWKEVATTMTRRLLHDFNNTIAGIYSLSELYAEPGSDRVSMMEAMGHIRDSAVRSQEITRRIRHLTTLENSEPSYFRLDKLVADQAEYLSALLPKGAHIGLPDCSEQLLVRLDEVLFRQAILHLASNACDAAGANVAIDIQIAPPERCGHPGMARLDFKDNGAGFKSTNTSAALEPFYTTKDAGKHPGLGLNIVKEFVESLGGSIKIASSQSGATISLYFPLASPETREPSSGPNPKRAPIDKEAGQPPAANPRLLVYSWEDVARHPLILAMRAAGWELSVCLDASDFLLDLAASQKQLDGLLFFKSALDERAEPLLSELGHAKRCPPIAVIAIGESVDAMPESTKRHCGLIAPGTSKPTALFQKLAKLYTQPKP